MSQEGIVPDRTPKIISRKPHTLPPQRWRIITIVIDHPGPGEAHLTAEELKLALDGSLDLPAGLTLEWATIEKAASAPGSDR